MSSAATSRPSGAMTNAARSARFGGDFGSATARKNSDERTSTSGTLAQGFGSNESWQASSGIWGNGTIGSGIPNSKRDATRSQGGSAKHHQALGITDVRAGDDEDEFPLPNGSSALRSSSQANPWGAPANGPWNPPDTTSPTLQSSHSGSTSPAHHRSTIPTANQPTLAEIQNPYQQSRVTQAAAFSRGSQKSSLNPSSGPFTFGRKPSFIYTDDKENSGQYGDSSYDYDHSVRALKGEFAPPNFLATNGSMSRDSSMPPSKVSEPGLNGAGVPYGSSGWGSIGHTPTSSIHSQRPSFSGPSVSFPPPTNQTRFVDSAAHSDSGLSDKMAAFGLSENNSTTASLPGGLAASYSPNPPNFTAQVFPHSGTSPLWEGLNGPKGHGNHERYGSQPFLDQGYFKPHAGERDSISPAGSDYRRGFNSPKFYHHAGTPPSGTDQIYRPSSRGPRIPQGPTEMDRRLQTMFAQQQAAYLYGAPFQGQFRPQAYEYAPSNFRQPNIPYGYAVPMPPYAPAQMIPTRPKDQDVGLGVRSPLLEEFRSNSKSNKRYDLKDIYNHVVEFSGDQHGSRFIQQKLETANSDEKEQLFREIQPNALQLMTDVFGNYVIQKLFEHGNQIQKRVLAEQMKNHVMELSMQMYGCRVVQKALEHVLADQQAELVDELRIDVLKCVKDQNGNHVVQKAIERVPKEHIQFIIDAFKGQVHILATHSYGCRVIQRILEYCKPQDQAAILEELHQCAPGLISDQFGNYVIQHVIQHGKPEDRIKIIKIITAQLLMLSKHKFASNVVEKCIQFGTDEQRKTIVAQMTALNSDGSSPLQLMMKDQYGNYVIQKLLLQLKGAERDAVVEQMKPQLAQLKKFNYGKQITAIEKLIFTGPPPYPTPSSTSHTMPIEINSSAPTPMLTNGQNSPQSCSLPSASASTIDDPTDSTSSGKTAIGMDENTCPEVVINGA
ncbi:ARM repeat-containing protein [Venustampulla echinocandica]|uniref:Pumilio homology domain family member 3 n=1 Tax=Venustampulla echinocandica TaxID=2656787 RepID=A0A370TIE3_9HELO|nr:ARM repeat-containing protein [Venustampulla echinocandica]RDL35132.1 ARM repeat-containing protein [Venustampulla echinocandica]